MIVCVLCFITFFEFSSGPIAWLYNAEILHTKALSLASFLNWLVSLGMSIGVPVLAQRLEIGWIFLFFALLLAIGSALIWIFMKETMGKTQDEI